jgi:hypothetical protein
MMDEENQINDKIENKLKIMKFSLLPCGIKQTQFFLNKFKKFYMLVQ